MAPNLINTVNRSSHTHTHTHTHTHIRIVSTLKKKKGYRAGVGAAADAAAAERRCLSKFHTRLRRSGVEKETVAPPH